MAKGRRKAGKSAPLPSARRTGGATPDALRASATMGGPAARALRRRLGDAVAAVGRGDARAFGEAMLPLSIHAFVEAQQDYPMGTVHFAPVIEAVRDADRFADAVSWLGVAEALIERHDPVLVIVADYLLDKAVLAAALAARGAFAPRAAERFTDETAPLSCIEYWEQQGGPALWAMCMEARRLAVTDPVGALRPARPMGLGAT